jgi:hypothetical protein
MTRPCTPRDGSAEPDAAFHCEHCGRVVLAAAPGTDHRNHCPWCLWSLHVDLRTGDRLSGCRGKMEPIAVWVRGDEWILVHRCRKCGLLRSNRIAGDDLEVALLSLALRPLARPPFPLWSVGAAVEADGAVAPPEAVEP